MKFNKTPKGFKECFQMRPVLMAVYAIWRAPTLALCFVRGFIKGLSGKGAA